MEPALAVSGGCAATQALPQAISVCPVVYCRSSRTDNCNCLPLYNNGTYALLRRRSPAKMSRLQFFSATSHLLCYRSAWCIYLSVIFFLYFVYVFLLPPTFIVEIRQKR